MLDGTGAVPGNGVRSSAQPIVRIYEDHFADGGCCQCRGQPVPPPLQPAVAVRRVEASEVERDGVGTGLLREDVCTLEGGDASIPRGDEGPQSVVQIGVESA